MRFGVRFDTKQQTGGSGEEPPVSSILESNSAKLRAKNSVLQSKMNNLCQISRQIFRRSFSRNSARYKTFMFLCQAPRLCQIDRLPCRGQESAWLLDISDAGGSMLASGMKLVPGSPNCLAGYGDAFNGENIVVTLSRGKPGDEEAPGDTLNVLWFPEGEESPFTLGDPMETLGEAIRLAGE